MVETRTKLSKNADFGENSRTLNFKKANKILPKAREQEIEKMLQKVDPSPGEVIVDWGCGQGILSEKMAEKVGPEGSIISLDTNREFLKEVNPENRENIETKKLEDTNLPLEDKVADKVVSLAGFHHSPDKKKSIREMGRVLKEGGELYIGDVEDETEVQRFFDNFIDEYCSTGHKYTFLNQERAERVFEDSELKIEEWENKDVSWKFRNRYQIGWFIKKLFDMNCSRDKCLQETEEILGLRDEDTIRLNWNLFFLKAQK